MSTSSTSSPERLYRPKAMRSVTGNCIAKDYQDVKKGLLPPPIKIGARASAWVESEITAVQRARIAGKSDDEIKELVSKLVAERQARVQQ